MTDMLHRIRVRHKESEIEIEGSKEFIHEYATKLDVVSLLPGVTPSKLEKPTSGNSDSESIRDFYRGKNPSSYKDTVLLFYYWLKKNEDRESPTYQDIEICFNEVSIQKPSRIRDVVSQLVDEGLLIATSKSGVYKISLGGEEYIECLAGD